MRFKWSLFDGGVLCPLPSGSASPPFSVAVAQPSLLAVGPTVQKDSGMVHHEAKRGSEDDRCLTSTSVPTSAAKAQEDRDGGKMVDETGLVTTRVGRVDP